MSQTQTNSSLLIRPVVGHSCSFLELFLPLFAAPLADRANLLRRKGGMIARPLIAAVALVLVPFWGAVVVASPKWPQMWRFRQRAVQRGDYAKSPFSDADMPGRPPSRPSDAFNAAVCNRSGMCLAVVVS